MSKKKTKDHLIWGQLAGMELGEEFQDDVWTIVKVPQGYIVNRLNWSTVFIPKING